MLTNCRTEMNSPECVICIFIICYRVSVCICRTEMNSPECVICIFIICYRVSVCICRTEMNSPECYYLCVTLYVLNYDVLYQ